MHAPAPLSDLPAVWSHPVIPARHPAGHYPHLPPFSPIPLSPAPVGRSFLPRAYNLPLHACSHWPWFSFHLCWFHRFSSDDPVRHPAARPSWTPPWTLHGSSAEKRRSYHDQDADPLRKYNAPLYPCRSHARSLATKNASLHNSKSATTASFGADIAHSRYHAHLFQNPLFPALPLHPR